MKSLAGDIPPGEMVFFRSFFALPVVIGWAAWQGKLAGAFTTSNPQGHFWRGLVGTTSMALGFLALGLLPLPEVVAIGYAAPLLATIFAAMFLGEAVRLYRMSAIGLGLIGVVIILYPAHVGAGPRRSQQTGRPSALSPRMLAAVFTAAGDGVHPQAGSTGAQRHHRDLFLDHGGGSVAGVAALRVGRARAG